MTNIRIEVEFQIKDKIMIEGKTTSINITDLVRIDLMIGLNMFHQEIGALAFQSKSPNSSISNLLDTSKSPGKESDPQTFLQKPKPTDNPNTYGMSMVVSRYPI